MMEKKQRRDFDRARAAIKLSRAMSVLREGRESFDHIGLALDHEEIMVMMGRLYNYLMEGTGGNET